MNTYKKFHSCCDWFYKNIKTGKMIMFCGLDLARDKKMKKFEQGKKIICEL